MKIRKLFKYVNWLVKIYANKVMFKFISNTIAVAVKVFLAVGDSARRQGKRTEFYTNILLIIR